MDKNGCTEKNRRSMDCWLQMIRTYEHLKDRVATLLQKHNLSLAQFEVLSTLAAAECTNQQELADRLQVTKGNLVGLIDRLTERGWAERAPAQEDRRVNRVRITPAGKELIHKALPEQASVVHEMLSALNETERDHLRSLLTKLAAA